MAVHREECGSDALARAAAAAIVQIQQEIKDLFDAKGRAGVVETLRLHSARLSKSGIASDQIRARALEQAADDLVWGRAPLSSWTVFIDEGCSPSTAQRMAVRLQVGPSEPNDVKDAIELCRVIEMRLMSEESDAVSAAKRLPQRLRREQALQEALWDDPRLPASPETRRLTRAVGRALKQKLSPAPAAAPPRGAFQLKSLWRSLLSRVQAKGIRS